MGLGFQAAYGADALQQNLRQRLMDQIAAQQRAQALTQQGFENDLKTKQFQSGEELKQAQLKALVEDRAAQEADRQNTVVIKAADTIPAKTELAPSPLAGRLVQMGLGTPNMTLPSTQTGGGLPLPADPGAEPDAQAAPITGTLRSVQSPEELRSVTKLASSKQQQQQDEADGKVEAARQAAENRTNDNEQKQKDRLAQIAAAAAARPQVDKLTKVEHKGPDGKTIIEYLPQSALAGQRFDKPTSGMVENRLASAQAVQQTGNDIITKLQDPNYAKNLGVAMGRFSKLQDFIGNPPPEFSELAGQIESYALASMGVHGMRSSQGAEKINHMLSQPHTPESLIGAIKGLNGFSQHFMENEGRGTWSPTATSAPAPATSNRTRYDINGNVIK